MSGIELNNFGRKYLRAREKDDRLHVVLCHRMTVTHAFLPARFETEIHTGPLSFYISLV